MAKVTFEFDENEDRADLNTIINRYKLQSALEEICSFRSALINDKIYDTTVFVNKDDKTFIDVDYVERRLGNALEDIYSYLDY